MNAASDPRTDRPAVTHRLLVALRFHDVFVGRRSPVRPLLEVSIDALNWRAYASPVDGTYRFLTTNADFPAVPPPPWDVTVVDPGGTYVNFAPFTVGPVSPAVVPPTSDAYLVERPLWPTRAFRTPAGETAVVGRVVRAAPAAVEGLEVWLFPGATRPATALSTFTDANGEFLFRLPDLRGKSQAGPPVVVTLPGDVGVEVREGVNLLTAAGLRAGVELGKATFLNLSL